VARTSTSYYAGVPQSTSSQPAANAGAARTGSAHEAVAPIVPAIEVLREEARLVIVDVTVLDKKGLPVKGLGASDFQLKEDNAAQKIAGFEEHRAVEGDATAAGPAETATNSTLDGTIVASNKPPTAIIWNVVLIDLYNTAREDRPRVQNQLEQFLKQLPEHEPVALVTMLSHIKIESSFEDGAGAAYGYLHKNGLGPVDGSVPANLLERGEPEMPLADPNFSGNNDVDREAYRAQTTLDCFSALARWLAPYPGRKNVYWLSGGFPLEGKPFGVMGYDTNHPGLGPETKGGHPIPMQEKTDKELETARVAIYPVDARGVAPAEYAGITTADTEYSGNVGIVTGKADDLAVARRSEMLEIAQATGGTAQFNNNISMALRNDFNQANIYYTISYTPPDKEWKGAYHRIQLSVDQHGSKLVYREGYYARSAETGSKPTPEQFKDALRLGAPAERAVEFTSKITKSGEQATVEYGVEPKGVEFEQDASGEFLADIDFAVLEYDVKGKVLDKGLVRLSGKLTPEQRAHVTAKTLSTKQTISLKAGATTLVLGVRDRVSGRFGSVEVGLVGR